MYIWKNYLMNSSFSSLLDAFRILPTFVSLFVVFFLVLFIFIFQSVSIKNFQVPVGVHPDNYSRYLYNFKKNKGKFKCFNTKKLINVSQINDNFKDCIDGSDEPGTAADSTGFFYCKNSDFVPQLIPKWSVGDGICDCCDGSDEWDNKRVNCPNTCKKEHDKHNALYYYIKKHFEDGFIINHNLSISSNTQISLYKWLLQELELDHNDKKQQTNSSIFENSKIQNSISFHHFNERFPSETIQSFRESVKTKLNRLISKITESERERNRSFLKKQNINSLQESISQGSQKIIWRKEVKDGKSLLGRYQGNKERIAKYRNGEYCWIARTGRKTDIEEICWDKNKLVNIVEYDNCLHRGVFLTPYVCDSQYIKQLDSMDNTQLLELAHKLEINPDRLPKR